MGAKKAKNHKPRLAVSIPPPPTDVTAEQYIAAMKACQGANIYAAIAVERMMRKKDEQFYRTWFPDTDEERLNVYIFPREAITSETSILYDQVPSRLYHHGPKYPIWKVPVEIMSMIFHQLPLFDRVNLARCSKRLAKIAIEMKALELEFKDRDELSDRKGFFADPSNFPHLWSAGTPGYSTAIYGSWSIYARIEIERQGGTYTKGIHHAIDLWFVCEMDSDDDRIRWAGY
jgi:hypothetical protein